MGRWRESRKASERNVFLICWQQFWMSDASAGACEGKSKFFFWGVGVGAYRHNLNFIIYLRRFKPQAFMGNFKLMSKAEKQIEKEFSKIRKNVMC